MAATNSTMALEIGATAPIFNLPDVAGKLVCLEMTPFRRPFLGPLFKLYFEQIVGRPSGSLREQISPSGLL